MNKLLGAVFKKQNAIVLQCKSGTNFTAMSPLPRWFSMLWPSSKLGETFNIEGVSPFLDNFLLDAHHFWKKGKPGQLQSGPWIETELKEHSAFEGTATTIGGLQILTLQNLGKKFQRTQDLMQSVRENLLNQEVLEVEVSKRTQMIRQRESEMAYRLIYAAGFRDEETGSHLVRIGKYSSAIAELLGWSKEEIEDLASAAPMHDLGKIGISDAILRKPSKLSDEEMKIMQGHARLGAEMLKDSGIPMLDMGAEIAYSHHEWWDGTGYPVGLKGTDIPMSARIVAIVDVYDALVHKRYYKPAFSEAKTLNIMKALSGSQFDPELFELFLSHIDLMQLIKVNNPDVA